MLILLDTIELFLIARERFVLVFCLNQVCYSVSFVSARIFKNLSMVIYQNVYTRKLKNEENICMINAPCSMLLLLAGS